MTFHSLESFKATARSVTPATAGKLLNDSMFYEDEPTASATAIWLYAGDAYLVETTPGRFWTMIDRDDWTSSDKSKIEARLYFDHYIHENYDSATREEWEQVARDFMATHGDPSMPQASLDDWLLEHGNWLLAHFRRTCLWILNGFSEYGGRL